MRARITPVAKQYFNFSSELSRFEFVQDDELLSFLSSEDCKKSIETEKFGLRVFVDYLSTVDINIDDLEASQIDQTLAIFLEKRR